jgi:anti-sigma factor RsiW
MDERDLKRLLRAGRPSTGRRRWRCPDATRLAAYVEHRLSAAESVMVEAHLAGCPACLDQVVFLVRQPVAGHDPVAAELLSRAVDLVPDRSRLWPALVPRWAGVAVATVCFLLVVTIELRQPGTPALLETPPAPIGAPSHAAAAAAPGGPAATAVHAPPPAAPPATVRKSAPGTLALRLVRPVEGATLSPHGPEFRWQPVPRTTFYEVQVLSEEGDVVWQTKVETTAARLPSGHRLRAGTKYFVWVRAHLSSGGSVRSAAVSFRVGGS